MWYHHDLLVCVLGSKTWGNDTKYYVTMSNAKTKEKEPKKLVNYSTEAWIVLLFGNCARKWEQQFAWEQDREKRILAEKNKPKKPEVTGEAALDDEEHPEDKDKYFCKERLHAIEQETCPRIKTKYTESDAGQQTLSGWTADGKEKFVEYRKAIKKAHEEADWSDPSKEGTAAHLELKVLNDIKAKYNKVGIDHEDERKKKRKRKRKSKNGTEDVDGEDNEVTVVEAPCTADSDEEDW